MTSPSVRQTLRDATQSQHHEIDQAASAMRLDTPEGYGWFLAAHAAVILPLEEQLERDGIAEHLPDWSRRARRYVLLEDLSDLNLSFTTVAVPRFSDAASLWGAAYVLEGSRLGARVVLTRLAANAPSRFLRHGSGHRYWPEFLMMLEGEESVRRAPQAASDAARAVFDLFARAMAVNAPARADAAQ